MKFSLILDNYTHSNLSDIMPLSLSRPLMTILKKQT